METNTNTNQSQVRQSKAYFVEPKTYLSKDGKYLTLVLPGNLIVRKPCNFFKAVMGLPWERAAKESSS